MDKTLDLSNDRVSALAKDGLIKAGVKYVGNLPVSKTIVKNSLGRLVKNTENWEFIPVLKSCKVYETIAAGTALKVYKNHNFGVGDTFYQVSTQFTISAIDTTADEYDVLTVASISATAADILVMEETPSTAYSGNRDIVAISENMYFAEATDVFVSIIANAVFDRYLMPCFLGDLANAVQVGSLLILPVNLATAPPPPIKNYKEFRAIISQTGSGAPTIDSINVNDFGETPVLTRTGAGNYLATFTSAIFADESKLETYLPNQTQGSTYGDLVAGTNKNSDTALKIISGYLHGGDYTVLDGMISKTPLIIRVYN